MSAMVARAAEANCLARKSAAVLPTSEGKKVAKLSIPRCAEFVQVSVSIAFDGSGGIRTPWIAEAVSQLATKSDLAALEQRLTIKFGGMLVIAVGVLFAGLRFIH